MVNILNTSPAVQNRFISLRTILEDADRQIDIVEDKYGENRKYLLTRFKDEQTRTVEEIAQLIAREEPKIPKISGLYVENENCFIIQDYIDSQTLEIGQLRPLQHEYELVSLLNRLLPVLSFLRSIPPSSSPGQHVETLRSLTADILNMTDGQGQTQLYSAETGRWNGKQHLSDQRAAALDCVLLKDNKLPTAAAFLKALNTIDQPHENRRLPAWVLYAVAGAVGLLAVVALASYLLSREKPNEEIAQPINSQQARSCPTGSDILPIGCNADIFDLDSPDFNGGILKVSVSKNVAAGDRIFLQEQNISTRILEDVQRLVYKDIVIGTVSSSAEDPTLEISFNENAREEAVEAVLQDVVYQNTAKTSSGTKEIAFQLTDGDQGESESTITTVEFAKANSAPTIEVPGVKAVTEDNKIAIEGIEVADSDAGESFLELALSVSQGTIVIDRSIEGGARRIESDSDRKQVYLEGTLAQLNQTLSGKNAVVYQPDPNVDGSDTLRIGVSDRGQFPEDNADWIWPVNALAPLTASATVPITITPVNDPPFVQLERGSADGFESESISPPPVTPPSNSQQSAQATNATIVGDRNQLKNVRAGNNTNAQLRFELPVGSRVKILRSAPNSDGFVWHEIYSPEKNASGWIANHLVSAD